MALPIRNDALHHHFVVTSLWVLALASAGGAAVIALRRGRAAIAGGLVMALAWAVERRVRTPWPR